MSVLTIRDDTRPYVFEMGGNNQRSRPIQGRQRGHAYCMQHYQPLVKGGDYIRGMGECDWGTDLPVNYAVDIRKFRLSDWAHFAPWSLVNFWPNFLEGMSHARHPWKFNNHADRTDGVDGWDSPLVNFLQRSQHPYLLQDLDVLARNPGPPRGHEKGQAEWPYQAPVAVAGKVVKRQVGVFNGGLVGNNLTLLWSAHWDKPDGQVAVAGGATPCEIEPGFHATKEIAFTVPVPGQDQRRLYLVMEPRQNVQTVFREDGVYLNIIPHHEDTHHTSDSHHLSRLCANHHLPARRVGECETRRKRDPPLRLSAH